MLMFINVQRDEQSKNLNVFLEKNGWVKKA